MSEREDHSGEHYIYEITSLQGDGEAVKFLRMKNNEGRKIFIFHVPAGMIEAAAHDVQIAANIAKAITKEMFAVGPDGYTKQ